MGVPFGDLLPRTKIDLEHIDTVAIDAYNAIYQFLSIIRQRDGTPLMDSTGRSYLSPLGAVLSNRQHHRSRSPAQSTFLTANRQK
jgi:hypothetical protein